MTDDLIRASHSGLVSTVVLLDLIAAFDQDQWVSTAGLLHCCQTDPGLVRPIMLSRSVSYGGPHGSVQEPIQE